MGIGPSGPPIPPPVTLSIVPFPKSRQQADEKQICDCFTFLIPSKSDEAKRDSEEDEPSPVKVKRMSAKLKNYTQICSDCKICEIKRFVSANVGELLVDCWCLCLSKDERATTPFKKKGSAVAREPSKRGRESQKTKRRSRISSLSTCSETSQVNNQATLEQKRQQRFVGDSRREGGHMVPVGLTDSFLWIFDLFSCSLMSFRWVVPANGEISLRIWFYRDSPGKFEQTFNFELLGTQRNYQLLCKGICSYPSICTDYRFGQSSPPWCICCS